MFFQRKDSGQFEQFGVFVCQADLKGCYGAVDGCQHAEGLLIQANLLVEYGNQLLLGIWGEIFFQTALIVQMPLH